MIGASICLIGNGILLLICLSIRDIELLDELNKDIHEIDIPVLVSLILLTMLMFSLIAFLFSDPGYIEKKSIKDPDNILYKISDEIELNSIDSLT